jgi:putative DNA methylase
MKTRVNAAPRVKLLEPAPGSDPRTVPRSTGHPRATPRLTLKTAARNGHGPTLLEVDLPFRELSRLAQADRRATDPVYSAHRWWARRPPSVMRGLLLAATLPAGTSSERFWELFGSPVPTLAGLRVHDLFVGGGTTVIEASRLGAIPSGTDVDPLAIEIVKHELRRPNPQAVAEAGERLLTHVNKKAKSFFEGTSKQWTPVHFFSVHEVVCPACKQTSALYRDLVIARSTGKPGAVVRKEAIVAFCPACFGLHHLAGAHRQEIRCCRQRHRLDVGTFSRQRFICPHCACQATHRDLKTGMAKRRLIAIEESSAQQRRRIRSPRQGDHARQHLAEQFLGAFRGTLRLPKGNLRRRRKDERPLSFGMKALVDLFTPRQLIVFGLAFQWIRKAAVAHDVRRALTLAMSNALATNNRLCSYATEYGRLAPLFSVRSYSLPALGVELNPLHPSAGRGTLRRNLDRVVRSSAEEVRRYVWSTKRRRPVPTTMHFTTRPTGSALTCASAEIAPVLPRGPIDLCLFDPPYFDYIAYSELSEFYRGWTRQGRLGGVPLLPEPADPVRSFSDRLARCLLAIKPRLRRGRPMVFTYHSGSSDAWVAIGEALDQAGFLVTGLWPMRNDSHMGHHVADGNCEWDVVVICRRKSECIPARPPHSLEQWVRTARPLRVSKADRRSFTHAIAMAAVRFGRPPHGRSRT